MNTRQSCSQYTISASMLALSLLTLHATSASAQGSPSGGVNGQQSGQSPAQPNSQEAAILQLQYFINGDALPQRRAMLLAHAIIACVVWAFLIPCGGILVRMSLKSPQVVKLHAILQVVSFSFYVAAVGLGIFLINTLGPFSDMAWKDAHPRLGLSILALAAIQPFIGIAHHRIFKGRLIEMHQSGADGPPRGTIWGQAHTWLGRILIILGLINGGLGLRLAKRSPAWLMPPPTGPKIAYCVSVALTAIFYIVVIVIFERRRRRGNRRNLVVDGGEDTPRVEEQKIINATGRDQK